MNCTLDFLTDIGCNKDTFQTASIATESAYTTAPIVAIQPIYHQPNEEELHTSFEQAISNRQFALQNRLSRLSNPILNVPCAKNNTDALHTDVMQNIITITSPKDRLAHLSHFMNWQRATILICLTLIFILLCFDFTSLLSLHIH